MPGGWLGRYTARSDCIKETQCATLPTNESMDSYGGPGLEQCGGHVEREPSMKTDAVGSAERPGRRKNRAHGAADSSSGSQSDVSVPTVALADCIAHLVCM